MTPTPEMIAMAERIAEKHAPVGGGHGLAGLCRTACFDAALTAIMEVSEKVSSYVEAVGYTKVTTELSDAIRNGEYLKCQ